MRCGGIHTRAQPRMRRRADAQSGCPRRVAAAFNQRSAPGASGWQGAARRVARLLHCGAPHQPAAERKAVHLTGLSPWSAERQPRAGSPPPRPLYARRCVVTFSPNSRCILPRVAVSTVHALRCLRPRGQMYSTTVQSTSCTTSRVGVTCCARSILQWKRLFKHDAMA